ncbi:MAG: twin-arginine translocase TatA/TatE family subunit [Archangium sp.]|nr:twin-arginine translocase TatA/TatE family subunit [Archangium sp.]MDP3156216.1 twin-arginine translocase TatA/TatE family subunit [Archangium sp.]MDP3571553.1 twin-arginine translocase TatA/TatE family subunit [Archangium sp.]
MTVGSGELIMLGIILVIVFSASQMGTLGNAVGRFVHSFRKASQGDGYVDVKPTSKLERGTEDAQVIDGSPKH